MKTIYVKDVVQKLLLTERIKWKKVVPAMALFAAMFFLGREVAEIRAQEPAHRDRGLGPGIRRGGAEAHRQCHCGGACGVRCLLLRAGGGEGDLSDL